MTPPFEGGLESTTPHLLYTPIQKLGKRERERVILSHHMSHLHFPDFGNINEWLDKLWFPEKETSNSFTSTDL